MLINKKESKTNNYKKADHQTLIQGTKELETSYKEPEGLAIRLN
jgi:hypothetical protein